MHVVKNGKPALAQRHREMEVMAFRASCGPFVDVPPNEWEKPGIAFLPDHIPCVKGAFVVRAHGHSMEPEITDRAWCVCDPNVRLATQNQIVLVEDRSSPGTLRYALKKFRSETTYSALGEPQIGRVTLHSLNHGYPVIHLDDLGTYQIRGRLIGLVDEIRRVDRLSNREIKVDYDF